MANWKIGITECRNKGQTKERIVTDTEKMLKGAKKTLEGQTLEGKRFEKKKEISDKVRKNKFIFNKRDKINNKESIELQRTHGNMFDWLKKGNETMKEKEEFEERKLKRMNL